MEEEFDPRGWEDIQASTKAKSLREAAYAKSTKEGYRFVANCNNEPEEILRIAKKYTSKGLQVRIHEQAFWQNGRKDSGMVAILLKEK